MEIDVTEYRKEPYGNRLGFAKVCINHKLFYLFIVAKDKETGDLKAFPPSQKTESGYLPCWDMPREIKDKCISLVLDFVKKMEPEIQISNEQNHPF